MLNLSIERLLKDEVIFELKLRNIDFDESAPSKELYKILREVINLEKEGRSFKLEFTVVNKDELKIIEDKLNLVTPLMLDTITSKNRDETLSFT